MALSRDCDMGSCMSEVMRETDACVEMSPIIIRDCLARGFWKLPAAHSLHACNLSLTLSLQLVYQGCRSFHGLCKEDRFEVVNSLPIGVLFKDAWICEWLSLLLAGFSVNGKVNNPRGQYSEMSLAHLYNN